jgi:hypothetical protein
MIKRRGGSQIGHLTPDHKSLKSKGQMRSDWSMLYTVEKIFSRDIRYCLRTIKKNLIWKRYKPPKFWNNKNPNFGSFREKWHFDVVLAERHKIYYKEGSGASSQRLWVVWRLCLKLFLLNPLDHFHSTCTNRSLFLVVQVDIILNSCSF